MTREETRSFLDREFREGFRKGGDFTVKVGDKWDIRCTRKGRLVDSVVDLYRDGEWFTRERLGRWKGYSGFLRVMTSIVD